MKIKITETGSKAFYRELLNVTTQYNKFLRKPEAKLIDSFRKWKKYMIWSLILLLLFFAEIALWGASTLIWCMIVLLLLLGASSAVTLYAYNKQSDAMLKNEAEAELILDEDGIELIKASMTVKLSWDSIAFARLFSESVCFIPKRRTELIIAVSRKYYDEISPYIKSTIYGNKS